MNKTFFQLAVMTALFATTATNTFSQERGKSRTGIGLSNVGIAWTDSLVLPITGLNVNVGYNLQDNINVGIRGGGMIAYSGDIYYGQAHLLGTYTHYFDFGKRRVPFVGGGLGVYFAEYSYYPHSHTVATQKFGGFLSAGFEIWKFRVAAEYSLLSPWNGTMQHQRTSWDHTTGQPHITYQQENFNAPNQLLTLGIGFYIGGGKWTAAKNRIAEKAERMEELEIAAEREQAEQAERERIANLFSTFTREYISPRMTAWEQRGEFETITAWQQRVNEATRNEMVSKLLKEAEALYIAERTRNLPIIELSLGRYDADNQTFSVVNNLDKNIHLRVPIDQAENFRSSWTQIMFTAQARYTIANDQIAFAGIDFTYPNGRTYRYTEPGLSNDNQSVHVVSVTSVGRQVLPVTAAVIAAPTPATQVVAANDGVPAPQPIAPSVSTSAPAPAQQGKVALGGNLAIGAGGMVTNFGMGVKLRSTTAPVRVEGSFTYFFPVKILSSIQYSMWDLSVNVHGLASINDKFALYGLGGLGVLGASARATNMDYRDSEAHVGLNFGGGFEAKLGEQWALSGEVKYIFIFTGGYTGGRFMFAPGLAYRF